MSLKDLSPFPSNVQSVRESAAPSVTIIAPTDALEKSVLVALSCELSPVTEISPVFHSHRRDGGVKVMEL